MILAAFKRLYYTDFPAQFQTLVEQLSYTVNNSFTDIYSALDNNISIRDNLFASVNDVTFMVNSSGVPTSTTIFTVTNSNPIDGLQVIKATNGTSNTVFPNSGIFITYTQSGSRVTITNITGLPANNLFTIRILSFLT